MSGLRSETGAARAELFELQRPLLQLLRPVPCLSERPLRQHRDTVQMWSSTNGGIDPKFDRPPWPQRFL